MNEEQKNILFYLSLEGGNISGIQVFNMANRTVAELLFDYVKDTYKVNLYDKKRPWWTIEIDEDNVSLYDNKKVGDKASVCGNLWFGVFLNLCRSMNGIQNTPQEYCKNILLDYLSDMPELKQRIETHLNVNFSNL